MIHTKELRFGNRLITRQGQVITVQQILSNSVIYESKIEVNSQLVAAGGARSREHFSQLNEVVKEVDCMDIRPIALTTDILRQCGFRNYVREQWILRIDNTNFDWEFQDGKLRIRNPAPTLKPIESVHELQNFLFAIAHFELEFMQSVTVLL
jgi:hypothetical protein